MEKGGFEVKTDVLSNENNTGFFAKNRKKAANLLPEKVINMQKISNDERNETANI